MIAPRIDDHVSGGRHMTAHTFGARACRLVVMVCRRVVFTRQMAGGAKRIAFRPQLSAMRVVAVAASDAVRVHLALQKRPPIVNLAALLAVAVVKERGEERRAIMVKQRLARFVSLRELAAPRMTLRAHLDLALGRARLRADGIAARCVHTPRNAAPLVEARCQALGAIIFRRLPRSARLGAHSRWCEPGP